MKHLHKNTQRSKMKFSKCLCFKNYRAFKTWYIYIKSKFVSLIITYIHIYKYTTRQCDVIIVY